MEFSIGAVVFLSSMLLLAIPARVAAGNPDATVLRGNVVPALACVLVTSGLTIGLLAMLFGGESFTASRSVEVLVILGFAMAAFWGITKLVGRLPGGQLAGRGLTE